MDIKDGKSAVWIPLRQFHQVGRLQIVHGVDHGAVLAHLLADLRHVAVVGHLVAPEDGDLDAAAARQAVLGRQVERHHVHEDEAPGAGAAVELVELVIDAVGLVRQGQGGGLLGLGEVGRVAEVVGADPDGVDRL